MHKLGDLDPNRPFHCLVYARLKVGKTFGALTFPRPAVLDFDGGLDVASNPALIKIVGWNRIKEIEYETVVDVKNSKGIVIQHKAFDDACRFYDKMMKPDKIGTFDTWIVDSGTMLTEATRNKGVMVLSDGSIGIKSATHSAAIKTGVLALKQQDYGAETSMTKQFVSMVQSSGKNVVFICHERIVTDEDGKITYIGPLLTGQTRETVPAMFNEVYRLMQEKSGPNIVRKIVTKGDDVTYAGSRLGIPDGTLWDWASIQSARQTLHKEQLALQEKK